MLKANRGCSGPPALKPTFREAMRFFAFSDFSKKQKYSPLTSFLLILSTGFVFVHLLSV
jgi:hypothetical protein